MLSIIYSLIIRVFSSICLFRPYSLNCKVVSVGNITLGGTGKTTLVEFIAEYLRDKGYRVAILSRGYKRKVPQRPRVPVPSYENMGDEPYMLKMNLGDIPVIVDADRIRAGKKAIFEYKADTVILDDGFQQWKIKKDLEIVAVNSVSGFGNKYMLPAGVLREPLSALARADIFVLTKSNLNSDTISIRNILKRINPQAMIIESMHEPQGFYRLGEEKNILGPDALKDKTVTLFCGIGDPDSFEEIIVGLGIKVRKFIKFPDHHKYSDKDLEDIIAGSQNKNIGALITTAKDAVRINKIGVSGYKLPIYVLRVKLKIKEDEEKFCNRLLGLYSL